MRSRSKERFRLGRMAEWSNAVVLKTIVLQGTGGSNPSSSAKQKQYLKMSNVKSIERIQTLFIVLVTALAMLLMGSCEKQEDVCGTIVGGYSEFNDYTGNIDYYFRLTTDDRARVDELTYLSFGIGDYVCLDY